MRYEKMKMDNDKEYTKAKIFFEQKIPVHVSLKSGSFWNGRILEEPTKEFFFIHDKEEGKMLVFFIELAKPITQYVPDEKNKKKIEEKNG